MFAHAHQNNGLVAQAPLGMSQQPSLYEHYYNFFDVVHADTQALKEEVFRLRYQVYCVENPFEDPANNPSGMESDAYDERSVHYLLRHRASGMAVGTVRIILPDTQNLMACLPIQQVCDIDVLKDPEHVKRTAEISRFCISQSMRRRISDKTVSGIQQPNPASHHERRVVQYATLGLIRAIFEVGQQYQIEQGYLLCEPSLSRVLNMLGVVNTVLGPKVEYHGIRQPVRVSDREVLRNTLENYPDIWEVLSDKGRLDIYH